MQGLLLLPLLTTSTAAYAKANQLANLHKQLLPGTARCLDNSPAGYYFSAGAADSTVWVINLEGGGARLSSAASCALNVQPPCRVSAVWGEG